jgi:aerobic carbon-monoxide dehydrogenase medium subunit
VAGDWLAPTSLEEALGLRAAHGDDATVVAGGTFLAILLNQGLIAPAKLLALRSVPGLDGIRANDELRLGALVTHSAVERSAVVRERWPAVAHVFSVVASPRIRNQATVGGVLGDADYASDPPAMLSALGARVVVRGARGTRELPVEEFIVGHYETSLEADELITEVIVPSGAVRAVYRKFRSRSHEDRPCVGVAAAATADGLRVVVGAVAGTPQFFPDICRLVDPVEIGHAYAEAIEPITDLRGSAGYRRRVIAVEVRRAVEEVAWMR